MMIHDERYGEIPELMLEVLQRRRVSPAAYQVLLSKFGYVQTPFREVEKFINANLVHGRYRQPRYM